MKTDPQLYEVCTACGGSGSLQGPVTVRHRDGTVTHHLNYPCPSCEVLRVVPVGITSRQLERLVAADLATKGGG